MRVKPFALLTLLLVSLGTGRLWAGEKPQPQRFDSKGVSIQYTVDGAGPPVVLVHGLFASGDLNWRLPGVTAALAKQYQVVTMDVRGHGGSGKPEEAGAYGVELVEDVVRLLDHLQMKRAHVIGYSMGGMITLKLLVKHPERVQSAVLGGMGWLREGTPLQRFWGRMPERKGNPTGTPSACVRSLGDLAVTEAEVKAIHVPVSVVIGETDPVKGMYVVPLEQLRPDWPVTVIKGAGHLNCVMQPEFTESLRQCLEQQSRTPQGK